MGCAFDDEIGAGLKQRVRRGVTGQDADGAGPHVFADPDVHRVIAYHGGLVRPRVEKLQGKQDMFPPSVNLSGRYGRFGDHADVRGSLYQDPESWSVLAVASWDFWEWGRTKYNRDYHQSRQRQTQDQLTDIRDQVALEVKSAYLLVKEAEKRIGVTEKSIVQADENLRIYQERYRVQAATSKDVLDAQTLLVRARADYYDALSDHFIALARLERSMGVIGVTGENSKPSP